MSGNARGSGRNQRTNPYQLEELFVKFHRTPAGIAWRWRTELASLAASAAALLAARFPRSRSSGRASSSAGPSP